MNLWVRLLRATIASAVLAATAGCSDKGAAPVADDGGGGPVDAVSFAADVQPIFDANCVGCHGAVVANGGLNLSPGESYDNLVGVTSPTWGAVRVIAGDAENSVLYRKLSGAAGVGDAMPPTGRLADSTLELVRRWIDEGADDN